MSWVREDAIRTGPQWEVQSFPGKSRSTLSAAAVEPEAPQIVVVEAAEQLVQVHFERPTELHHVGHRHSPPPVLQVANHWRGPAEIGREVCLALLPARSNSTDVRRNHRVDRLGLGWHSVIVHSPTPVRDSLMPLPERSQLGYDA